MATRPKRMLLSLMIVAHSCWLNGCESAHPTVEERDAWIAEHRHRLETGESDIAFYQTVNTNVLLAELAGMPELESIVFTQADISAEGLQHLKSYPNLREVSFVIQHNVDDSMIQQLRSCTQLKSITFDGTSVTDDGIRALQEQLPNCQISKGEW